MNRDPVEMEDSVSINMKKINSKQAEVNLRMNHIILTQAIKAAYSTDKEDAIRDPDVTTYIKMRVPHHHKGNDHQRAEKEEKGETNQNIH